MRTKIIIGKTYGMLTVDAATEEKDSRGRTLYRCTCECTGIRLAAADRLLAGRVTSCGCMRRKNLKQIGGSKERAGWTPEQDAVRIAKRMERCKGIYLRGESYIAQIKIRYKTYYLGSYQEEEAAKAVRDAVVHKRIEHGDDAAIEYIAEIKKARLRA